MPAPVRGKQWTKEQAKQDVADGITEYFDREPMHHYLNSHNSKCWRRRPVCSVCETDRYFPFDDASEVTTWD